MAQQLSQAVDLLEAAQAELILGHIASMAPGRLIELQLSDLRGHSVEAGLLVEAARRILVEAAMSDQPDQSGNPIPQDVPA
jgi:hypothetical protein